jgi:predicted RNA-binding protein with PIN domain
VVSYLIVDALNVLHCCEKFQKFMPKNLPAAAAELERLLSVLPAGRQVLLVYDGGAVGPIPESASPHPGLAILRTPTGVSADGLLVALARRIRRRDPAAALAVVSDDGGLRAAVSALGGEAVPCRAFFQQLQQREAGLRSRLERRSAEQCRRWPGRLGERLDLPFGDQPIPDDPGRLHFPRR